MLIYGAYGISDVLCGGLGLNINYPLSGSIGLYHQAGEVSTYSTIGQITTSVPVIPMNGLPAYYSGGQSVQSIKTHEGYKDIYVLANKTDINASGGYGQLAQAFSPNPRTSSLISYDVLAKSSNKAILLAAFSDYELLER